MKQDEFLKQVESTPAYRENPQVRAVFETHRAELEGKHGDELLAVHVQIMHELAEVLNAPASNPTPEAPNTDQAVQEFNTTIDAFRSLTVDEKLKIKLIPSTYARALKGAQALSPTEQFPNQSRCLTELKKLTVPEWRDICNLTEEPSLAIEPAKSFEENLQSMNLPKNLVYRDANNQPQVAAYVNPDANSPYKNATKRPKGAVHIVEGKVHPKAPPSGTSAELGKRKEFYQTT